jgi:hypothetical protein
MKKSVLTIGLLFFFLPVLFGQATPGSSKKSRNFGKSNAISFSATLPVGVFQRSHFAGAGLSYSWSQHRFGWPASPGKWIGLTLQGGADYYFGKKVKTAGYDFRYGGYIDMQALAGIIYNPWANIHFTLIAGPTLSVYKNNTEAGLGINLSSSYALKKNIAVGPAILYRKQSNADALWGLALRASYLF